jgi:predicted DNA-binding transcriptional regulator AlpA
VLVKVIRENVAAAYLGLSQHTLRWHRRRGTGPGFYRLGKHSIGYFLADLDAWLAARHVDADPEIVQKAQDVSLAELIRLAGRRAG